MQRGRLLIFLGLLLFLGVGVLALLFFLRGGIGGIAAEPTPDVTPVPAVEMTQILIAVQPIERGQLVPAESVALAPWPVTSRPSGALTDIGLAVGKQARNSIEPGQPILETMLTTSPNELAEIGSDAALRIPEGRVAITLPMTRLSGVGYALTEGDHVNVLVALQFVDVNEDTQTISPDRWLVITSVTDPTTQATTFSTLDLQDAGEFLPGSPLGEDADILVHPSEVQRPRLVVQQVVQDAIVLKVGSFADVDVNIALPTATPLPEGTPPPPPTPIPPPDIITLMVQPQDSLVLNYFMFAEAKFTLALRSAGDPTMIEAESVTLPYVIERFRISVPTRLTYALEPAVRVLQAPVLPNEPLPVLIPLPDGSLICGGANCP
jgi:Flp pilus assembly protein CpaB